MIKYKQGIANDSILLAIVRVVTYTSTFIQTMIMSRVFSKFEYGRYSQACLIVSFLSPFLLLGLSNAVNYFYNQEKEEKTDYVQTIFNLIIILGLSGGILIILFRNLIANYFGNLTLIALVYIVAFRPLLQNLISLFQVLYISSNKALLIAKRNIILALVQLGIAVVAAYCMESVELVLVLLVVTDLIQVIVFYLYFCKKIMHLRIGKIKLSLMPEILRYALPLALSTMVGTLSINMDLLLIGKMMSTEQFALYSNMAKELPFNFLIAAFTDMVFPRIINLRSRNDIAGLLRIYKSYIEFGLLSTLIMIGGAIVCAKDIILILYSEKYVSGIAVFYIYLLVSALRFTYHGMLLSAYGKSNKILKYSVVGLVSNFVLNIILFNILGMVGPAIATFITVFLVMLFQLLDGVKLLNVKIVEIIDLKYMMKVIIETFVLVSIFQILNYHFQEMPIWFGFVIIYGTYIGTMIRINKNRLIEDLKTLNRE